MSSTQIQEIVLLITVFGVMIGLSLIRKYLRATKALKEKLKQQNKDLKNVARSIDPNTDRRNGRYIR